MHIPEELIRFKAVRSGRPGGQNADRRSTKVQAWVRIADLPLSTDEKKRIRERLHDRINKNDELEAASREERLQGLNKEHAVERLQELIAAAVHKDPERIPTEPPRGAKEERIRHKHLRYEKKEARRASRSAQHEE